jgi:hypothetical protein
VMIGLQESRQGRHGAFSSEALPHGLVPRCTHHRTRTTAHARSSEPANAWNTRGKAQGGEGGGGGGGTTGGDVDKEVERAGQGLAPASRTEQRDQHGRTPGLHELLLPLVCHAPTHPRTHAPRPPAVSCCACSECGAASADVPWGRRWERAVRRAHAASSGHGSRSKPSTTSTPPAAPIASLPSPAR